MPKVDRRILKSQESIKKALTELMSEKNFDDITIQDISDRGNVSRGTIYLHYIDKLDLLDKLIETHIYELHKMCAAAADLDFIDSTLMWYKYFENNYLFFSTMLASKGAPYFRSRFLKLLIEELRNEVNVTDGINHGIDEDVLLQFLASAYVGNVEWWLTNGMPLSPDAMAKYVGLLLERNI